MKKLRFYICYETPIQLIRAHAKREPTSTKKATRRQARGVKREP